MAKPVLSDLEFAFKAKLSKPVVQAEELGALAVNQAGSLIYDGLGATPSNKFHFNDGGAWREILDASSISNSTDFLIDPNSIPTRDAVRQYVETTVAGVGAFKGSFDASGGTAPTGAGITAGDYYRVTVAGTLTGLGSGNANVQVGDIIVASIDSPAGNADYFALQSNFEDANDILVGGTFTASVGVITGTTTVKDALQYLKADLDAASTRNLQDVFNADGNVVGANKTVSQSTAEYTVRTTSENLAGDQIFSSFSMNATNNATQNAGMVLQVESDLGGSLNIFMDLTSGFRFSDSSLGQGMKYGSSATYANATPLTLMPKEYIDSVAGATNLQQVLNGGSTASLDVTPVSITETDGGDIRTQLYLDSAGNSYVGILDDSDFFTGLSWGAGGNLTLTNEQNGSGAKYSSAGDYANATALTLMPKEYIDSLTSGGKFIGTITGNATATDFAVAHGKNTKDVIVQVRDSADNLVEVSVTYALNAVTIGFGYAPAGAETFTVIVL